MKNILMSFFLLFPTLLWGEVINSPIHSIEKLEDSRWLVKFENGRVGYTPAQNKELTERVKKASRSLTVAAQLDHDSQIIHIESKGTSLQPLRDFSFLQNPRDLEFVPSIISSLEEANKIFKRLNSDYKRSSECSNRAHVWAYEEFTKNNISSKKVFVLFTASYINRNKFKWWFHVAPALTVKIGNSTEDRVLDYMFDHGPRTIKEWTDNFVFSKRPCKLTTRFSEYDVNPQTEDCYLMIDTMYNWNPRDLHHQELYGRFKKTFLMGEIKTAYSEAFHKGI